MKKLVIIVALMLTTSLFASEDILTRIKILEQARSECQTKIVKCQEAIIEAQEIANQEAKRIFSINGGISELKMLLKEEKEEDTKAKK